MRSAIVTVKPIDDHGRIDDEMERSAELPWDGDITWRLGTFIKESVLTIEHAVMQQDDNDYVESLPAFDITLELREK